MFVLILAPYKVGTCYLDYLLKSNGIECVKLHSYDDGPRRQYPIERITHVITARRELKRLWLSALFQNLTDVDHYAYAFGNKEAVARCTAEDIVEHFFRVDWTQFPWLNYAWYEQWLKEFEARNVPILRLSTETLSKECREKLPSFLGVADSAIDFTNFAQPSHCTTEKGCGLLYKKVLELLSNDSRWQML